MFLMSFNECLHNSILEHFSIKDKARYRYEFDKYFSVYPYGFVGERKIECVGSITEECILFLKWVYEKIKSYQFPQISINVIEEEIEFLILHVSDRNVCSIKEEELKTYFKLSFKGGGNGTIDYFTNNLLPDLKQKWCDKDFAKIALMIYESGELIPTMRPKTFKTWYKKFCELVGCGFHEGYRPSILKNDKFKRIFYYLQK